MKRMPTNDPEVVKYDDGTFYYRGTPPGQKRQIERSLKTKDEREVKRAKLKLLTAIEEVGLEATGKQAGPLMLRFVEDRRLDLKNGEIRENTFREAHDMINNYLEPFYARYKLAGIDTFSFKQFRRRFGHRDYTNHRKILIQFLKWCKGQGLIRFVPDFELGKWEKRQREILTETEILNLLGKAHGNLLLFISMYLFMGMRRSEIVKLTWDRVDLDRQSLKLRQIDTKTNQPREIPVNLFVMSQLRKRSLGVRSPWVFPNKRKESKTPHMSVSGFRKPWVRLLEWAKVDRHLTPHDMRATWEKYAHLNPEFSKTQLEKMAGASIEVQKRDYVRFSVEELRGLEKAVDFKGLDQVLTSKIVGENAGDKNS